MLLIKIGTLHKQIHNKQPTHSTIIIIIIIPALSTHVEEHLWLSAAWQDPIVCIDQ